MRPAKQTAVAACARGALPALRGRRGWLSIPPAGRCRGTTTPLLRMAAAAQQSCWAALTVAVDKGVAAIEEARCQNALQRPLGLPRRDGLCEGGACVSKRVGGIAGWLDQRADTDAAEKQSMRDCRQPAIPALPTHLAPSACPSTAPRALRGSRHAAPLRRCRPARCSQPATTTPPSRRCALRRAREATAGDMEGKGAVRLSSIG